MEQQMIKLRILLPYRIFCEPEDITAMTVETSHGSLGILPNRLDCTAAIVPGILSYRSYSQGVVYLALDEGVMVKAGRVVSLSVRNAIGGKDLGELHKAVEKEFLSLDEREREVRTLLAKIESSFIRRWTRFQNE